MSGESWAGGTALSPTLPVGGRREEYREWRRREGGLPPLREDKGGSQCQGGRNNCSTALKLDIVYFTLQNVH